MRRVLASFRHSAVIPTTGTAAISTPSILYTRAIPESLLTTASIRSFAFPKGARISMSSSASWMSRTSRNPVAPESFSSGSRSCRSGSMDSCSCSSTKLARCTIRFCQTRYHAQGVVCKGCQVPSLMSLCAAVERRLLAICEYCIGGIFRRWEKRLFWRSGGRLVVRMNHFCVKNVELSLIKFPFNGNTARNFVRELFYALGVPDRGVTLMHALPHRNRLNFT